MASPAQIAANRLNATHSTGPRTGPGKAASARNAMRHNLCGTTFIILPGEDAAAFHELSASYLAEFRPATPHESFLIGEMVQARWRLERIARLEAEAIDAALEAPEAQALSDEAVLLSADAGLARFHRYRATAQRAYYRANREFHASRKRQYETRPIPAGSGKPRNEMNPIPAPAIAQNEPKLIARRFVPNPRNPSIVSRDGFEPPTHRLESYGDSQFEPVPVLGYPHRLL